MLHFSFAAFNSDNRELQNCITATCIKIFKPSEPLPIYFSASYFQYNGGDYQESINYDESNTISAPTTFNKCKIKAAEFTLWFSNSGNITVIFREAPTKSKDFTLRNGHETGEIVDFEK